ncbi:abscisic acid G-protein coupled receptor domain-containing protein [Hirsutella rhossiliensis]|uniref:Abscisic acid g-protein coupled receptor domain-containing protein n=1 Tax=Hirsutella rhossiliensis TaxID=111463 RepID=A0A9P8MRP3_9HYPO|nr:abscisic acid g-protein coupled receptor domain-containing protein [Hirsutella rhossiliensis]KAH0959985.1 abscisic acid g-protein coupled receptor domain-containing protein [Hirsutella rhossiliensis]
MWPSMILFSSGCDDADACAPSAPGASSMSASTVLALVPFAAAFALVDALAVRHVFPKLSSDDGRDGHGHVLPEHAPAALRHAHAEHAAKTWRRRAVAWTFGATVALAATLGLLIMAEIVEAVDPAARNLALALTVPTLLFLLVLLVPWLECRSLVTAAGWTFHPSRTGSPPRVAWALNLVLFAAWLLAFWSVGRAVPVTATSTPASAALGRPFSETLTRACLERVGVVGISLMALLAGFASVSSPWHTLHDTASRRRRRPLTEVDVQRKQVGLDAANEMLLTKRHQLQALERKASRAAPAVAAGSGLIGKMLGSLRAVAGGDEAEMRALRVEIAGLEAMEASLASKLCLLKNDRAAAARASTPLGRLLLAPSYVFSVYCLYRIVATSLTTLRRASSPSASFASSDPINRFLGLVARHWDPTLDQAAWARTISFALSGVILVASANSAVQTFHLFARWTPGLLRHAQANLALVVGQIAATYVISASLLLRGQLPADAGGAAVGGVLRGALSPQFVDGWFEAWFLLGSALTALGLWVGRRLAAAGGAGGDEVWDDDYGAEEMGAKRM